MLRRNPRQDAPRSPTCPTSQPCLHSRNPGHIEECIRGRDRPRGQEGERAGVSARGARARGGSGSFRMVFPERLSAREGGVVGPGSPRP